MPKTPDDPLERIIRPIVEGQIRSFVNDHPEVVDAVNWYRRRADKRTTLINSVSKRIVRDLLCEVNRRRLELALLQLRASGNVDESLLATRSGEHASAVAGLTAAGDKSEVAPVAAKETPLVELLAAGGVINLLRRLTR